MLPEVARPDERCAGHTKGRESDGDPFRGLTACEVACPTQRRTYTPSEEGPSGLPWLLLVNPDGPCYELLDGLLRDGELAGQDVSAQEIKAPLDPPDDQPLLMLWTARTRRHSDVPNCVFCCGAV